jgi:hypothetical protein
MVKILKATFGDDFGSTDVMKTLSDRVKDEAIDIYVDSSIIPLIDRATGAKSTNLSDDEKRDIKSTAEQMCGPTDQVCLEIKIQELADAALKKKESTRTASTTEVIKGRKLKVTYQDASGGTRTAVIPEGQQFQVGNLGKAQIIEPPVITETPDWMKVLSSGWGVFGLTVMTFLWASSIILTWMTFVRYGSKLLAAGMVAIAVFIPYSGFGLVFFGPLIAEFLRVEKLARLKAVVPEEFASAPLADLSTMAKGVIPTAPSLPEMAKGLIPPAPDVLEDPTPLAASMRGGWRILLGRK